MTPEAAIAFACRSAIAVSCGSVLTADRPCACRYREIVSAMSSACASVAVIATTAPSKTVFIARFPTSPATERALQRHPHAVGQRRPARTRHRAICDDRHHANLVRTAPLLRAHMIVGQDRSG